MPHHGEQHKSNGDQTANPFEEQKRTISVYTAQEIATLQSRLDKRLGPEYISTRPGPGNQKVAYVSAGNAINLANEVFGFNGWSTSIQQIDVDFVDENQQSGKVTMGVSVIIRVTLKDGTYHEDIGYGGIENCKGKAAAFEKSKKEATTDALKRTLRTFGNVLGNCLNDRTYITQVSKVKAAPGTKFDVNDLHRHPDFAPKKEIKTEQHQSLPAPTTAHQGATSGPHLELEDSFDMGEFDDADFDEGDLESGDGVLIPTRTTGDNINTPSKAPPGRISTHPTANPSPMPPRTNIRPPVDRYNQAVQQPMQAPLPGQVAPTATGPTNRPAGFYSARAAQNIDQNNISSLAASASQFNPHAESPSIRKTSGIDHNKSVPVKRDALKTDAAGASNVVDPKGDMNRRIGMPGQHSSTGIRAGPSVSSYRPPTRHGSPALQNNASMNGVNTAGSGKPVAAVKRAPLADVSNGQHSTTALTVDGADAKRQRLSGPEPVGPGRIADGVENG